MKSDLQITAFMRNANARGYYVKVYTKYVREYGDCLVMRLIPKDRKNHRGPLTTGYILATQRGREKYGTHPWTLDEALDQMQDELCQLT